MLERLWGFGVGMGDFSRTGDGHFLRWGRILVDHWIGVNLIDDGGCSGF